MVYLPTLSSYLTQSSHLLTAYPHTTRITTKYTLPSSSSSSTKKPSKRPPPPPATTDAPTSKDPKPPQATLTFKTYEPSSGICLKYKTNKQAEVGRLINGLGRLARGEDPIPPATTTGDAEGEAKAEATGASTATTAAATGATGATGGGSGAKKKKKGKK